MNLDLNQMQQRNLQFLIEDKGFQFSETFFPYTSGQIGPYQVNSEVVMKHQHHDHAACNDLADLVQQYGGEIDIIAGGESRDWIFSNPVAIEMSKARVMIYKDGKCIGADMRGKHVALVSDLNNEGSSPRDKWVPVIKSAGGIISQIFFYVDRLEDGVRVMEELGLESHAVVPLNERAWDYLQRQRVLSSQVYTTLRERMEDKDAWARRMLRSEAGKRRLAELYDENQKEKEKVFTVIARGYPDLREELFEALGNFSQTIQNTDYELFDKLKVA
ncbi:MAG: hypothetical protein RL557_70 [archaeon]|jgi:orotate phosphoribosyltransferase